jgi:hypothetical protein
MTIIAPGNMINFGSPFVRQGVQVGPLEYVNMAGYVDIPPTNIAGPLPWVVESPIKDSDPVLGISLPNPHRLLAVGLKVPAVNRAGQPATLIGTNTATFRNGNATGDTGGAIVTFSGTSQGAIDVVVATPFPAATAAAPLYQFYSSANIRSSNGTMRLFGWIMYAILLPFPNPEQIVQVEQPVYKP